MEAETKEAVQRFTTAMVALGEEQGLSPAIGVLGAEALLAHFAVRHGMSLQELMINIASNVPEFYATWLALIKANPTPIEAE